MNRFLMHTDIAFGKNATERLKDFDDAFIVCDSFFASSPLLDKVTCNLKKHSCFSDFTPDPTLKSVAKCISEFKTRGHKCIIALGGGSAIDTAKAVIYFSEPDKKIPFAAIPTTSGTGSEVTSFSVVTDDESGRKFPLVDKKMLPDLAVLDVDFVKSVPKTVAADTGADVLSHALESYVAKDSSPFSDALCEKAISIIFSHLKSAVNGDINSKEQVHFASTLAGMAFEQTNLGLCHAMAHNIGGRLKVPHGRANAILLPHIILFNAGNPTYSSVPNSVSEKYAKLSMLLNHSGTVNVLVKKLVSDISALFSSIGLPEKFKSEKAEKITDVMAEAALKDGCINGNPVPVTKDDIIKIYKGVI